MIGNVVSIKTGKCTGYNGAESLFFCSGETASCLFNYPDDNKLLDRELPGTMLTLDEQCERDRGTQACFVSTTNIFIHSTYYYISHWVLFGIY